VPQIEETAFVTRLVATKKKPGPAQHRREAGQHENEAKKMQFKPVSGARPVTTGPPTSKVRSGFLAIVTIQFRGINNSAEVNFWRGKNVQNINPRFGLF
jgi:hypothetical protein